MQQGQEKHVLSSRASRALDKDTFFRAEGGLDLVAGFKYVIGTGYTAVCTVH